MNIEDVYRKLLDLQGELTQITTVGIIGQAKESKQDDLIIESQNIISELQLLIAEIQTPTALANQDNQNNIITELQTANVLQQTNNETLELFRNNSSVDILKFIVEQQIQTNNLLKIILS